MLGPLDQTHPLEKLARHGIALLAPHSAVEERQGDVLERRFERNQVERLEDKAEELVAEARRAALGEIVDQLVAQPVGAAVEAVQNP